MRVEVLNDIGAGGNTRGVILDTCLRPNEAPDQILYDVFYCHVGVRALHHNAIKVSHSAYASYNAVLFLTDAAMADLFDDTFKPELGGVLI